MSTDTKGLGAGDIPEIAFGIVAIIVAILSFMKGWLFLRNRRFTGTDTADAKLGAQIGSRDIAQYHAEHTRKNPFISNLTINNPGSYFPTRVAAAYYNDPQLYTADYEAISNDFHTKKIITANSLNSYLPFSRATVFDYDNQRFKTPEVAEILYDGLPRRPSRCLTV